VLVAACVAVILLVTVPATLLQVGLRDGSAPWFHTNDSTYQIELADNCRHGIPPTATTSRLRLGAVYSETARCRRRRKHPQVASGTSPTSPVRPSAAAWSFVPSPFDD